MKRILFLLLAVALQSSLWAQDQLPTTEVRTLKNQKVQFNSIFKPGKVTLVSFWATWCIPCKKEIVNIRKLLPQWRTEMDIDFITVSEDDSRSAAKVASYAASQKWDFATYLDPNGDLKRALNFQNVPFTMIIDAEGKIAFMHSGYEEGGEAEIYRKLKELTTTSYPNGEPTDEHPIQEAPPQSNE